jgi:hypothetical protein
MTSTVTVLEIGVILDSLPIYRFDFRCSEEEDYDREFRKSMLVSGWFSAIEGVIKLAFSDEPQEFRLKNQIIFLDIIKIKKTQNMILYLVFDKKDSKILFPIKTALSRFKEKILSDFNKINPSEPSKNHFLDPFVKELFKDLRLTSLERAKQLF